MSHKHSIHDTGSHFLIDPISRMIKNKTASKYTIIQNDHLSERFTFELPRYIDGHDMLECNRIEIHYLNIENGTKLRNEGYYLVDDMQICANDNHLALCTWLISRNATKYVGALHFLIRFACTEEEETKYVWNTAIFKDLSVSQGIDCSDAIAESYPDLLEQWQNRMEALVSETQKFIEKIPAVDPHLSESGSAADAKVVGERFTTLEKQMEDLLYQPITIESFTNSVGTVEIGSVVTAISFSWSLNKIPETLTLDGIAQHPEFIGCGMKELNIKENKTFTLKAVDERGNEATKTTSISFLNGVYYGIGTLQDAPDSAFLHTLTKTLRSSKLAQFSVNAGENQYIYYCVPSRFGACTLSVNGFSGGFPHIATIAFTNASGYTENYDIYRSDYENLGHTTVTVK